MSNLTKINFLSRVICTKTIKKSTISLIGLWMPESYYFIYVNDKIKNTSSDKLEAIMLFRDTCEKVKIKENLMEVMDEQWKKMFSSEKLIKKLAEQIEHDMIKNALQDKKEVLWT